MDIKKIVNEKEEKKDILEGRIISLNEKIEEKVSELTNEINELEEEGAE